MTFDELQRLNNKGEAIVNRIYSAVDKERVTRYFIGIAGGRLREIDNPYKVNTTSTVNGDGSTATFDIGEYITGRIRVYLNGIKQFEGADRDYVESSKSTITFIVTPSAQDQVDVEIF